MAGTGSVKGLAVITFTPGKQPADLWEAGKGKKWPGTARLTRVATLGDQPVYRAGAHAHHDAAQDHQEGAHAQHKSEPPTLPFRSFALLEADSEADLRLAGEYIEKHFSHVEVYAIGFDFGG